MLRFFGNKAERGRYYVSVCRIRRGEQLDEGADEQPVASGEEALFARRAGLALAQGVEEGGGGVHGGRISGRGRCRRAPSPSGGRSRGGFRRSRCSIGQAGRCRNR